MSELREAAQAVVVQFNADMRAPNNDKGRAIHHLRTAPAQPETTADPETTAEPVAWLNRYHAAMVTQDRATANAMGFTTPLYAHPPRDEWRPASEPPEDAMFSRGAVAAIVAGAIYDFAGFMTTRPVSVSIGASDACGPVVDLITSFAEKRGLDLEEAAVQSWNLCVGRDVQPPTEGER